MKITKPKNISSIFEGLIAIIVLIACLTLVFSPFLLEFESFRSWVQKKLFYLYQAKSTYLEMLGAIVGSFLAVSGALVVQRIINKETERKVIKENALIIYYDFLLGFNDIKKLYLSGNVQPLGVDLKSGEYENVFKDIEKNTPIRLYFSNEWIKNVAIIADSLSKSSKLYIERIYNMYGDLHTIKDLLEVKGEARQQIDKLSQELFNETLINNVKKCKDLKQKYENLYNRFWLATGEIKTKNKEEEIKAKEEFIENIPSLKTIINEQDIEKYLCKDWLGILHSVKCLTE